MMDIEAIRDICTALPLVTEDVKWGNDLCFMVGGKMFCVTSIEKPLTVSLKVTDEEFGELTGRPGIISAPYVGRYKWVLVEDTGVFTPKEWEHYIMQSYNLIKSKLPKKEAKS